MNNPWPNGQANGMFMPGNAAHLNPSMYTHNLNPGQAFDVNQFGMSNGASSQSHTPQPLAQGYNQPFTPGSLVPAKRSHDGMSGSPQQQQPQQQPPPGSRSQTPSYNNFPGQQSNTAQYSNAPTPYQHLQQSGSNNATPSPTLSNQPFRPPQQQQAQQPQPRMNTASPSPFPQHSQPQYGNQMSPMPQNPTQSNNMQQPGQMNQFAQNYGMGPGMSMPAMQSMQMRMNNMNSMNNMAASNPDATQYQQRLLQHQQQLRASMMPGKGMAGQPGQMNLGGQQPGGQMANGQPLNHSSAQMMQLQMQQQQQQAHAQKRTHFLRTLQQFAVQSNRPLQPTPTIGGKPVDLYYLWSYVLQCGGSSVVEQRNLWKMIANKMSFAENVIPNAAEELKQIYVRDLAAYEQYYIKKQKENVARQNSQAMAGLGNPQQSPNKMMQAPSQPNQFQQFQQSPQTPQHPQATLPPSHAPSMANGMATPQQMMGGPGALQHRRSNSLRKPEPQTPQPESHSIANTSPLLNKQRPASMKRESTGPAMKNEEPQNSNYEPQVRYLDSDGGYDLRLLEQTAGVVARIAASDPALEDLAFIDVKALTLGLASGLHNEVRYSLDTLATVTNDPRLQFMSLEHCEDLLDALMDCAEVQIEILSDESVEVSDALDLPTYEDLARGAKLESMSTQDVPGVGSSAYELDRATDKIIGITTILRNLSFFEVNHRLLNSELVVKWTSNTIRLLGTRTMLLRSFTNTLDFYKDVITFLSNVTQNMHLPSKDDALHILHFLLAFAPQPAPSSSDGSDELRFSSFNPQIHRYLPPAVDCLAKLLARQDPNREMYRLVFSSSSSSSASSESPSDLLTRAFALSISVLPDRSKYPSGNSMQLRIVEARKAYLTQGMLAADILSTLAPANDPNLARAWLESDDGWAVSLMNLCALLSVETSAPHDIKRREPQHDHESHRLITYRALTMVKRLVERIVKADSSTPHRHPAAPTNGEINGNASTSSDTDSAIAFGCRAKWAGVPFENAILGAMLLPGINSVALGLLYELHAMVAAQEQQSSRL